MVLDKQVLGKDIDLFLRRGAQMPKRCEEMWPIEKFPLVEEVGSQTLLGRWGGELFVCTR